MKRIILQILTSIAGFFNKMSDQEAERITHLYNLFSDAIEKRG